MILSKGLKSRSFLCSPHTFDNIFADWLEKNPDCVIESIKTTSIDIRVFVIVLYRES